MARAGRQHGCATIGGFSMPAIGPDDIITGIRSLLVVVLIAAGSAAHATILQ
jgi:hypothetical protein